MHSFRIHVDGTVTWTLKHETSKEPVLAKLDKSKADGSNRERSRRCGSSAARSAPSRIAS